MNYLLLQLCLFLTFSSFLLSSAKAQEERDSEKITFGIGIELNPSVLAGDLESRFQQGGFVNFIAPIQLGAHIFIEPELGIYIYNQDQTLPDTVREHVDQEIVRTGFGVFYSVEPDKSFEWYIGARLGILSSEMHVTHSPVTSAHAEFDHQWGVFYSGATFGIEYFFSPHFAIGGELQLNHFSYGAPIINEVPWTPNDSTHNVWATNATVSARFFF